MVPVKYQIDYRAAYEFIEFGLGHVGVWHRFLFFFI
jgi:hypothetical protein